MANKLIFQQNELHILNRRIQTAQTETLNTKSQDPDRAEIPDQEFKTWPPGRTLTPGQEFKRAYTCQNPRL